MASLQIDLFDKSNDRRIWVILRDNLPIKDLIHKLIQDLELPQEQYVLVNEENNLTLPEDSTLAKESIKDQHPLSLEPKSNVVPVPIPIPLKKDESGELQDSAPTDKGSSGKQQTKESSAKNKNAKMPEPGEAKRAYRAEGIKPPPNRPIQPRFQRPFHRPAFLRRIPNNIWNFATPLNTFIILILIILVCFFSRCVNNNRKTPMPTDTPGKIAADSIDSQAEQSEEQAISKEEPLAEEEIEIILPDLDRVHASLPDVESNYPGVCSVIFNTEKEPFDDINVRKVFASAIDREYISGNWTCDECHFREQQPLYTFNPEEFYTVEHGADFYSQWAKIILPEAYSADKISFVLFSPKK